MLPSVVSVFSLPQDHQPCTYLPSTLCAPLHARSAACLLSILACPPPVYSILLISSLQPYKVSVYVHGLPLFDHNKNDYYFTNY